MQETLVLLAVTRMLSGFCIAGIDQRGAWSRPTKRFGTLSLGDISYRDRTLMHPFERVRFEVERRAPDPPHVEDRICDFVRRRPEREGRLSAAEQAAFLAEHAEVDAAPLLVAERSLALIRAEDVSAIFRLDDYSGKYEARLQVPSVASTRPLPCTDLRWRALGRSLLPAAGGSVTLGPGELRGRLGCDAVYLALGLARQLDGKFWPLVVGVHLVPNYEVAVDPKNP